ncbi:TetR family transcriptional regulator, partial [Rhizobium leguminosarum]|uniref:TetR family transcriptional regulator n=1 Tax=Rhizobium leguminosarum TaxID=384 RepID=UPI003F974422
CGARNVGHGSLAKAAGISRASLYLSFNSKEELFRAGSMRAHTRALDEVGAALARQGNELDRMEMAIAVFQRELIAPFGGSSDAEELFA